MTPALLALALAAPAKPPNVVFLFADDWGRHASCYAKLDSRPGINSVIKTPNIDAVAARGAIYKNAFVNAPSCTPCRSAILSGRYFFNCGRGAILNGAAWDESIPSFPLLMRDAGYHIGKTHKVWSPGNPSDAPFGRQKYAYEKAGRRFNNYSEVVTAAVKKGQSLADAKAELLAEVAGNFDAFLKTRDPGKPLLYWFGPTNVHRMWVRGSGKALWGIDPDSLEGKLPANLPDAPEVREDFADYLGEAQAFDAYVGVIVKKLADAGELDNTILVISGDHGAAGFPNGKCNLYDFGTNVALITSVPGGVGGRVVDDFVNLMDLCPTFLEAASLPIPPGVNGKSLLPLMRADKSGQIDPTRDSVITGRERHVDSARAGNLPYPSRALRTRDYLYIRNFAPDRSPMGDAQLAGGPAPDKGKLTNDTRYGYPDMDAGPTKAFLVEHRADPKFEFFHKLAFAGRPAEELYDLKSDPGQVKNVAADPAFAAAKAEMATRLVAKLTAAGDPRVLDKSCRFDRMPFTTPRE